MSSCLPWSNHLARFREVLCAALETPFYRSALEQALLADPLIISRIENIDEALSRLPRCDLPAIMEDFDALFNSRGPRIQPFQLFYPLASLPRTAILAPGFEENHRLRVFDQTSWRGLARWKPEAIASPAGVLRALALAVREGSVRLPPLTYPIVVFTGIEHGLLYAADRDLLWQVFGVPLFEQLRGLGGELLATECEAHHGLHVGSEEALVELDSSTGGGAEIVYTSLTSLQYPLLRLATGISAGIFDMSCECGSHVPRLSALRRHVPRRARAAASATD
jgi:hypothetical protein